MTNDATLQVLRNLPSVDFLLNQPTVATLLEEYPRAEIVRCIRGVLEERREAVLAGESPDLDLRSLALDIRESLYQRTRPSLRRVINATGIVLHTGLGRAPLASEAVEAITEVAAGYSNLELDLETGRRGNRHEHLRDLLSELTGAEDALVVNNNAAGTYLALNTLAAGRPVIVSRGQLVEIGGSYRMPDIMAAAGCQMVEVGTTNRTHLADYERAIGEDTAVLLHVHTSNYRVRGFVTAPEVGELAELAQKYPRQNIVVVDDLGSGLLSPDVLKIGEDEEPTSEEWDEPTVCDSLDSGADLTLFSGDKLIGGPQAGILVGRADLIERLRKNPLARTFRPDKMTLAGLEATLRLYRDPESLRKRLPVYRLLLTSSETLEKRAKRLAKAIEGCAPDIEVECEEDESFAGGGTLPTVAFDTWVVRVQSDTYETEDIAAALRAREVPVVCRISDESLVFDCRTLTDEDGEQLVGALAEVLREFDES